MEKTLISLYIKKSVKKSLKYLHANNINKNKEKL